MANTPMQNMINFMNELLKIEDNLIVEYKDAPPKQIQDIKDNWQQLNRIKEIAITLLEKEKDVIMAAYRDGCEDGGYAGVPSGEEYFNSIFNNQ